MPYIDRKDRAVYDSIVNDLMDALVKRTTCPNEIKGHHNYIMFTLALKLARFLGVRYHTLQDIVGTFECCKQEFIRRVVSPYEDGAIAKNGDVEGLSRIAGLIPTVPDRLPVPDDPK